MKLEIFDKKIVFGERTNISYCTFTAIYEVKLEKLKLNTFKKRLIWLITGKI